MNAKDILQQRIASLRIFLRENTPSSSNRHVLAFAHRILGERVADVLGQHTTFSGLVVPEELKYCGYPCVASLGFSIGAGKTAIEDGDILFIQALNRVKERPKTSLSSLYMDDLALLGIADGLSHFDHNDDSYVDLQQWLLGIIDEDKTKSVWSFRMRNLAGDLLDGRGRLKVSLGTNNIYTLALELVLQRTWKKQYLHISTYNEQPKVLSRLLTDIEVLDYDKVIISLQAINYLVEYATDALISNVADAEIINLDTSYADKLLAKTKVQSTNKKLESNPDQLNELYQLLNSKIHELRTAKIIETDVAIIFKLERQIAEAEQELEEIETKIKTISQDNDLK